MSNSFSKEEIVAFEDLMQGFNDALVLSRAVSFYNTDSRTMERTNDVIWRPVPYISQSFDGLDQTGNFSDYTQLSVPSTLGFQKSVPWILDALELRDLLQENRLGQAAQQRLASDINRAITTTASLQGTLVVSQPGIASGYDDIALCESVMNEQGVVPFERYAAMSTRDYNNAASNLAGRQNVTDLPRTAYERSYVGMIASYEMYKMDYADRLAAATATGVTIVGEQFYTPVATITSGNGGLVNVDNRYMNLNVAVGGGLIAIGDCITIAGVNAVHHITKQDTGQLKTFRVTDIISGGGATGTIQISPPIISNTGGTDAEAQYQNVTSPAADAAAVTFLNTQDADINLFWQRDALEILPGRYAIPTDAGAAVRRATTDQGIEVVWQKQYDINTAQTKYRLDTLFGVVNLLPEQSGILLFSQT